jgi:putative FmdB family regulatory protein
LPIFVYRCECGNTFERLVPRDAPAPTCPDCGNATRKIPGRPSIGRSAGTNPTPGGVSTPWRGAVVKGAEGMHREVQLRENIVAKGREYPGNPGSTATSSAEE